MFGRKFDTTTAYMLLVTSQNLVLRICEWITYLLVHLVSYFPIDCLCRVLVVKSVVGHGHRNRSLPLCLPLFRSK